MLFCFDAFTDNASSCSPWFTLGHVDKEVYGVPSTNLTRRRVSNYLDGFQSKRFLLLLLIAIYIFRSLEIIRYMVTL